MPIYRYQCYCGKKLDEYRKVDERHHVPHCHGKTSLVIMPTMVSVFNAYMPVAGNKEDGSKQMIRSKAEHEAFLRRNGYEEVGNDKSMAPPHPEELAAKKQKWKDAPDTPMVDVEKLKKEGWLQEDLTV